MPRRAMLMALALVVLPVSGTADICVENATGTRHFFAAELEAGPRVTRWLAPGETLCAQGPGGGVVSAFPDPGHLEGCSRLVPAGRIEPLLRYADFDRCAWGAHEE